MRSIFLFLGCFLWCFINESVAADLKDFERKFRLLPAPQKVELLKGKGLNASNLRAVSLRGFQRRPDLDFPLKDLPLAKSSGKGTLSLVLRSGSDLPESKEGYILEVRNEEVVISGSSEAGLFYGCQTLLQLLEDAQEQRIQIPALKIVDYPGVEYRAVHWDLKYHLDVMDSYYRMIDRLARVKINAVIVEFEDKLRYREAAKVGASHAMSIEEFAALCRYANDRHIEVSPLVQGLGHVSFILKHDEYKHLRDDPESDWVFDPLKPEVYDLQFSLYKEAIEATPGGKYLHVGGDEVYNLGKSELSKKSGMKTFELQMYWLNKVCEFARENNRIPIFWDDMLFQLSGLWQTIANGKMSNAEIEKLWEQNLHRLEENVHLFPKDCIYMRWEYSRPKSLGNLKAIDWYKSHNLKVMAAPASQSMSGMLPRENSLFQPVKDFCEISTTKKMDGIMTTAWDDSSPHFETYWRGFYDYAWLTWNFSDLTAKEAHKAFRHRFYAAALTDDAFEFQDSLEVALTFWDSGLINTKRHRNRYPRKDDSISLPVSSEPGKWSEKYKNKVSLAALEIPRYEMIKSRIEKAEALAVRNHYSLSLMKQMNEVQIYPAKLVLLLDKYDRSTTPGDREAASKAISAYVETFAGIRQSYEDVFGKTRLLRNPEGYILDQNSDNMLANGTNTSDWMFVHELTMNKHIRTWLKK